MTFGRARGRAVMRLDLKKKVKKKLAPNRGRVYTIKSVREVSHDL